jgi:radical SAM protein with 4Fe4S-binding SPASM domain
MKKQRRALFFTRLANKKRQFPFSGLLELTYRCNLNCVHCYCKGSEDRDRELDTRNWKKILAELQREGCITLCLSGGEPLIRDDFLELYSYAKAQGFIIEIFSNGLGFNRDIIDYLVKAPPYSIEITLNGISQDVYESITQIGGSFHKVISNIKAIVKAKLPLILKTNCLKQNKDQIGDIKAFTEGLLGSPEDNKFNFKYSRMIYPRHNLDRKPTDYRLSFEELSEVIRQDADIRDEYCRQLQSGLRVFVRKHKFLYYCNSWRQQFFINPYGRLKFCMYTDKFSTDLRTSSFKEGFYKVFPRLLREKFKTDSKCRDCSLRPICYHCPAKAHLETGNEEAPVEHYCRLAQGHARAMGISNELLNRGATK